MFGKDPLNSGFAKAKINSISPTMIGMAVGGLAGALGGGGGGGKTTSGMPKWLTPYYTETALPDIKALYESGPAEYYEGDMVADLDPLQLQAIGNVSGMADPLNPAATNYATSVLAGDYLGGDQFMNAYGQDILENVTSMFGKGGRSGSQYGVKTGTAELGAVADRLYSGERDRQNQILQGIPSLVESRYTPAEKLMMSGDVLQKQQQLETDADVRAWDYEQNKDKYNLQTYMDFLGQVPSQQSTTTQARTNPLIAGLGGAMSGAYLGSNWGK